MQESCVQIPAEPSFHYAVYGVSLRSQFQLALPTQSHPGVTEIEFQAGTTENFLEAVRGVPLQRSPFASYRYAHLQDGSTYVRWDDVGEFVVSLDGHRVSCARFDEASEESFEVYLLGQALAFALVKSGFEPVHATCVVIDGQGVAFLGDSGYGKSSLAASFLEAGHQLLTDDILMPQRSCDGFQAYPGPPRIKLFPEMAQRFLGHAGGVPMNSGTQKLIIALNSDRICNAPVPLQAIYALVPPAQVASHGAVRFRSLSPRESFVTLVRNTFNYVILDSDRLRRQFIEATGLATTVPVKEISYPRLAGALPAVRDAILSDLNGAKSEWGG
jgi:hypothetical protein